MIYAYIHHVTDDAHIYHVTDAVMRNVHAKFGYRRN